MAEIVVVFSIGLGIFLSNAVMGGYAERLNRRRAARMAEHGESGVHLGNIARRMLIKYTLPQQYPSPKGSVVWGAKALEDGGKETDSGHTNVASDGGGSGSAVGATGASARTASSNEEQQQHQQQQQQQRGRSASPRATGLGRGKMRMLRRALGQSALGFKRRRNSEVGLGSSGVNEVGADGDGDVISTVMGDVYEAARDHYNDDVVEDFDGVYDGDYVGKGACEANEALKVEVGKDEADRPQEADFSHVMVRLLKDDNRHEVDGVLTYPVDSCSVCLEEFAGGDEVMLLLCRHVFHETCVQQWFENHSTCPTDREDLNELARLAVEKEAEEAAAAAAAALAAAKEAEEALKASAREEETAGKAARRLGGGFKRTTRHLHRRFFLKFKERGGESVVTGREGTAARVVGGGSGNGGGAQAAMTLMAAPALVAPHSTVHMLGEC